MRDAIRRYLSQRDPPLEAALEETTQATNLGVLRIRADRVAAWCRGRAERREAGR